MGFLLALLLASSLSPITPGNSARSPEWVQPGSGSRSPFINVRAAPYFAVGDGVADDRPAVVAAIAAASAAGGGIVYFPRGSYAISASFTIPDFVWLEGVGAQGSRLLRTYTGDFVTAMGNYAGIERMGINLQNPTFGTGIGVHIIAGNSQRIVDSEIRACAGPCLQFEHDVGTLFVSMGTAYFTNGTVGTVGAVTINGTDINAASRSFFGAESGGCTLYDFGGGNDIYVYGGYSNGLIFGTTSQHVLIAGMRIGNNGIAATTIKGGAHHIMGNEFATTVTLDASTSSTYFESGVPSNLVTDNGTNNLVVDQNINIPGTLVARSAGPHAVGGPTSTDARLRVLGAYTGTNATYGIDNTDTLFVPATKNGYGFLGEVTLSMAASGTHDQFAQMLLAPPTIAGSGAAITKATTLQITGAPAGGATNRALWIQGGLFETAGDVLTTSTKNRGSCTLGTSCASIVVQSATICTCADTTAAAACRVSLSGTTLTITGTGTDVINYHCF